MNKDKKVYKEAKYGKKSLLVFSSVLFAISVGVIAFGISLVVHGCKSDISSQIAFNISFGVMLILLALASGSISLVMLITALGMINTNQGSVKDGNRAMGTINIVKCAKCGTELSENAQYCTNCGQNVAGIVQCECGEGNNIDAHFCSKCGKELKK